MNKNIKISDELLIAYIENELSKEDRKSIENVLQSDDKSYLRYVDLYHSKKEIEEAKLEVTPDILPSKALPSKQRPKSNAIKERLLELLKPILAPKPAISLAASMVIILFIITNIGREQSDDLDSHDKETIDNILKGFGSTQMSPAVFNTQEILLTNNTLVFEPELLKSARVVLISLDNDTLLTKEITEKTSSMILSDDLMVQVPIKVAIIYDNLKFERLIDK